MKIVNYSYRLLTLTRTPPLGMLGMAKDDEASNGLHWGWSWYLSTNISLSNMMSVNNKQTLSNSQS